MNAHHKPDMLCILFLFVSAGVTLSTLAQADGGAVVSNAAACRQAITTQQTTPQRASAGLYAQMLAMLMDKATDCQEFTRWMDSRKQPALGLSLAQSGIRYGQSDGSLHTGLTLTADDRAGGVRPLLWVGIQGRW